MNALTPFKTKLNFIVLALFSFIWVVIWAFFTARIFHRERPYYEFALSANSELLREVNTIFDKNSSDYYAILEFCDRFLSLGEKIQIILPQKAQHQFEFFREKGRYILYPRNYGDNTNSQKYILVYQVSDFQMPEDYKIIKVFGPDKYLMKRDHFPGRQSGGKND